MLKKLETFLSKGRIMYLKFSLKLCQYKCQQVTSMRYIRHRLLWCTLIKFLNPAEKKKLRKNSSFQFCVKMEFSCDLLPEKPRKPSQTYSSGSCALIFILKEIAQQNMASTLKPNERKACDHLKHRNVVK